MNASVEFNVETLSPTYKLLIGVPGRSNAFEISKRLGLMNSVIERAKSHMSEDSNEVDSMIASLEESKKRSDFELTEAEQLRKDAEDLHAELQKQILEFNEERDKLFEKAEKKQLKKWKLHKRKQNRLSAS